MGGRNIIILNKFIDEIRMSLLEYILSKIEPPLWIDDGNEVELCRSSIVI